MKEVGIDDVVRQIEDAIAPYPPSGQNSAAMIDDKAAVVGQFEL